MGTLKQEQFPLGWTPNSNETNGDPRGLLRADNLVQTEDGVVSLSKGCRAVSTAQSSPPHSIYSRSQPNGILRYAAVGGSVYRNPAGSGFDPSSLTVGVISGGADTTYAAFGNAWARTIICSGTKKVIDSGLGDAAPAVQDIELGPVNKVGVSPNPPPASISPTDGLDGQWVMGGEGKVTANPGNYVKVELDATSLRGIAHNYNKTAIPAGGIVVPPDQPNPDIPAMAAGTSFTWDSTKFDVGPTGHDTPNDLFNMDVRFDPNALEKIRVELILTARDAVDSGTPNASDYYFHEWYADTILDTNPNYFDPDVFKYSDSAAFMQKIKDNLEPGISFVNYYKEGQNFWGVIQCLRSQFKRIGSEDSLSWKDIKCIRVTFKMTAQVDCYFWKMKFMGGADGQLNGWYQYVQVNCNDTGVIIQRSPAGTPTDEVQLIKANANITPAAFGGNCNKIEIYRSSTQTPGFFLVKTISPAATTPFFDNVSDIDALRDGIALEYYRQTIPDNIRYMIGPYYQRMIYFDYKGMYPSIRYDYGSVDVRHSATICSSGDQDVILWVKTVMDGVILVGTTKDIFQIRGDFAYDEATGLLNYSVEPMGITQVPVCTAVASYGTNVIYMSSDGWRVLSGSSSQPIIDQISQLYREVDCHGVFYTPIGSHASNTHFACVSRNRLICSMNQRDSTRALHIFDFEKKTWAYWKGNGHVSPTVVYTEEDGAVIFVSNQDKILYEFDQGYLFEPTVKQSILLRTTYNNDNKSNVRKDPLSLTIRADTGGDKIKIYMRARQTDGSSGISGTNTELIANVAFTGLQSKMFNLQGLFKSVKDFQLEITDDTGVGTFKLNGYEINYVDHPQEVNYLFIPNDNLGTAGRKRMPTISFIMDTQGNTVSLVPYIDGLNQAPQTFISNGKRVHHYYFTSDVPGYTRALEFTTGTINNKDQDKRFELYEVLPHREVELLPDPIEYKAIPSFNFGSTKRKRIIQFAFEIDTRGVDVSFTPQVDGVQNLTNWPKQTIKTGYRKTVIYYFPISTIGIDVNGILEGTSPFEFWGLTPSEMVSEPLPAAAQYLHIPSFNYGTSKRKRLVQYAFTIDTKGQPVTFTPYIDNVAGTPLDYTTSNFKQTKIYYFMSNTTGIDVHGTLVSKATGSTPVMHEFEFYGLDQEQMVSEVLPTSTRYLHIPKFNYGTSKRKRLVQFAFVIDTNGHTVTFTPNLDGVDQTTKLTFATSYRQTIIYYFTADTVAIDVGGTLECQDDATVPGDFEFYGLDMEQMVSEALPTATKYLQVPHWNYGTSKRKRIVQFAFEIDTKGSNVSFTPQYKELGAWQYGTPVTVNTDGKSTYIHYFTSSTIGIDVGGVLSGAAPFEFYGLVPEQMVSEVLPTATKYLHIPASNFGTTKRKRFTQYGIVINTKGFPVTYTPYIDDVAFPSKTFTTISKDTVISFFKEDAIGIDLYGILVGANEFEFYGPAADQIASEALPAATTDLHVNFGDLGTCSKKRIRTICWQMDTHGKDVVFTPTLDGVVQTTTSTHRTTGKRTCFHYFTTDVFPVDIEGDLNSVGVVSGVPPDQITTYSDFEFYGVTGNWIVETLPTGRKYDQVGPVEFNRQARIYGFRIQVITENGHLGYQLFAEDVSLLTGSFDTVPNLDQTLECNFMKGVSLTTMRLEFSSASPFYRLKCQVKVDQTGTSKGRNQWVTLGGGR